MIKHIVMWKLKEDKLNEVGKIKQRLEALKDSIKEIRHIEVGINISKSAAAYDIVLYGEFDSISALERYRKHPEHVKVADFINSVRDKVVVVDYEV